MTSPAITVILPVHNAMLFLEAALKSILDQTFRDFRVIAIDDGSTDASGAYLDSVRDARLTVLHQEQAGLGTVLNRGIDLCDTPFLARMDADDISLPQRFEQQIESLLRDPDLVAVGSPLTFLVHGRRQTGLRYPVDHASIVRDLMKGESSFSHPTLMMRTEAARATRYRVPGAGEDLDFCLRLAELGRIANLEEPQYLYRLHECSVSMTKQREIECGYAYARLAALQRRDGLPEMTFAEFARDWRCRSYGSRVRSMLVSMSFARYRRARLAWARQSYLESAMHLTLSFALQPLKGVGVVMRKAVRVPRRRQDAPVFASSAGGLTAYEMPGALPSLQGKEPHAPRLRAG